MLTISTTNPIDQRVGCLPNSRGLKGFECEFCYKPVSSCVNGPNMCEVIDGQFFFPSPLNKLTYCYRATARINTTSVAIVQGNFNTGKPYVLFVYIIYMYSCVQCAVACPPQSLVTGQIACTNPNGSLPILGGLVVYNGTIEGAVAIYQCNLGYILSGNAERVCQSDGNWKGSIPSCKTSKYRYLN